METHDPSRPPGEPGRTQPVARRPYQPAGLGLSQSRVRGAATTMIVLSFLAVALLALRPWDWGSGDGSGNPYPVGGGYYNDGQNGDGQNGDGQDGDGQDDGGQSAYTQQPTDDAGTYTSPDDYGLDGQDQTPTDGDSDAYSPFDDDTTSADSSDPGSPESTVTAYFDAIDQQDYETAWQLGGANLGESYASFVAGFSSTEQDDATIESVDGDVVSVDLTAVQTDGSERMFTGTYTVTDGVITEFDVQQTN